MSTFEEDSSVYSFFTSDESSLDDSSLTDDSSWISESCVNESPITLLPYDNNDLEDLFTIKLPNKRGKFKTGSCLTREEFSQSLLSDLEKERPEYIMSVYTTPPKEQDLVTGFTGKPTIRLVVRIISNQIYITLGSAKRVFTEQEKTWYALPLFGGKRRRLGNITGTYGSSMNHGQVPGFVIYKLFTRQEIERGAQAIDTLEDYLILPEQLHFLPFINGSDPVSLSNFTRDIVYEIINEYPQDDVFTHNMPNVQAIASKYGKLAIANRSSVVIYDISTNTSVKQNFRDFEENFFADSDYLQLHIYENDLYVIGGYHVCILDVHNGKLIATKRTHGKETLAWTLSNDHLLIATEQELQVFKLQSNDPPVLIPNNKTTAICSNDQYVYTSHSGSDDFINVWKWHRNKLKHTKTFDIEESSDNLVVVSDKLYASFKRGVDILDPLTGELIDKIPAYENITKMFNVDTFVLLQEMIDGKSRLFILQEDSEGMFNTTIIKESADMYAFSDDFIFFQTDKTITWTFAYNLITETLDERYND